LRAQGQAEAKNASFSPGDPKRTPAGNAPPPQGKAAAKKAAEATGLASQAPATKAGPLLRRGGPRLLLERLFGVDPSVANEDVLGTIPQALFMMNSPMIHNRTQARPGTVLGEVLAVATDERTAL